MKNDKRKNTGVKKRSSSKGTASRRQGGPAATAGRARKASPKAAASHARRRASAERSSTRSKANASHAHATQRTCDLCPVFDRCGACSLLDVPYAEQLAAKQRSVADLFAGLAPAEALQPIIGMEAPFHYRNKVVSPYAPGARMGQARKAQGKAGSARSGAPRREILTGMYAKGTHRLIPTDACALENEVAKKVTLVVRDLMRKWDIAPYDEDAGEGFMRHAVVRVGHASGEVLVTLVTNDDAFPSSKSFCRELVRRVPEVTTVVQNVNKRNTNVILGEQERTLFGPGFILDELCGLSFRISSKSFYQVNATQTEVLYRRAIELADLVGRETVIDAYCGTGTIGLAAARAGAGKVIGVDNVEAAIVDARQNAAHNGVDNAEFVALDAGAFMQALAVKRAEGEGASGADVRDDLVLLMDPPRAGSSERFLDAAAKLAPDRIVYISCNPQTQARDVAYLRRAGYEVDAVCPVDMFPHTDHVECICRLRRA